MRCKDNLIAGNGEEWNIVIYLLCFMNYGFFRRAFHKFIKKDIGMNAENHHRRKGISSVPSFSSDQLIILDERRAEMLSGQNIATD